MLLLKKHSLLITAWVAHIVGNGISQKQYLLHIVGLANRCLVIIMDGVARRSSVEKPICRKPVSVQKHMLFARKHMVIITNWAARSAKNGVLKKQYLFQRAILAMRRQVIIMEDAAQRFKSCHETPCHHDGRCCPKVQKL